MRGAFLLAVGQIRGPLLTGWTTSYIIPNMGTKNKVTTSTITPEHEDSKQRAVTGLQRKIC